MKLKKLAPIFASIIGLSSLAACTQPNEKVAFGEYWRPASLETDAFSETLVYSVDEKEPLSIMYDYNLAYENGTYTTNLVYDTKTGIYTYSTVLSIDAVYTWNELSSGPLHDSIVTETKFYASSAAFSPISSKKRVISHSPMNTTPISLEDCYTVWNYAVETTYSENAESVNSVITSYKVKYTGDKEECTNEIKDEPSTTGDVTIDHSKHNYLDNELFPLILRAIPNNESSAKVQTFNPFAKRTQKIALNFSADASDEFTFKINGNDVTKTLTYRPGTMVLDERNPGGTQTAWIAKASNPQSNEYHNVILRLETPIYYGFGDLVYKLTSATW